MFFAAETSLNERTDSKQGREHTVDKRETGKKTMDKKDKGEVDGEKKKDEDRIYGQTTWVHEEREEEEMEVQEQSRNDEGQLAFVDFTDKSTHGLAK